MQGGVSALAIAVSAVLTRMTTQCNCADFIVAFSGGRDSTVLLHLASRIAREQGMRVRALHIDHGLHVQSSSWAEHCLEVAAQFDVDCTIAKISLKPLPGESVEAWARDRRYEQFAAMTGEGTCVLTAHHRADQIETVVQRVLHGSGPRGLAGIREMRPFARGYLLRPLLTFAPAELAAYAEQHALQWVEDPSNNDPRFVRNRVRHQLLPLLESAFPGASSGLQRLADIQVHVSDMLDQYCDDIIDAARLPTNQLGLQQLANVPSSMHAFVLKRALERAGLMPVRQRQLREILAHLCHAKVDAMPLVAWAGNAVRRYRDTLYFFTGAIPEAQCEELYWDPSTPLRLPGGTLLATATVGYGLRQEYVDTGCIEVRFRKGGERCRPVGRKHAHLLKKLFQEANVPPWARSLTPLLYINNELAAVASMCVCEGFAAAADETGFTIEWRTALYQGQDSRRVPR